jgi:hypothetical protein
MQSASHTPLSLHIYISPFMNALFQKLKNAVSRDKQRYKSSSFDLDLTYITERIIAMAYPAASGSVESTYRNAIDGSDIACMYLFTSQCLSLL